MRQNTLIRPTVTASFISYIFPGGLYIIPSLCSKLQFILQNFHSYHESFPQKQSLWSSSVYRARLRKQHGRHTCGFHLNDGYCMNAALSWVQRDERPGECLGGNYILVFLCYGASLIQYSQTHWGGQRAVSKPGHFLALPSPDTRRLQHVCLKFQVSLINKETTDFKTIDYIGKPSNLNSGFLHVSVWFLDEKFLCGSMSFHRAMIFLWQRRHVFNPIFLFVN